jgi:hypothetical protein
MSKQKDTYWGKQENPIKNIPVLVKAVLEEKELQKKQPKAVYKKKEKGYYIKDEKGNYYKL